MFRRTALALGSMFMAAGLCFAQEPAASKTEIKKAPIKQTNAASGKEMFVQYCTACHGTDGKGNGPAAPAMKVSPADLTQLAKKNGGKYPSNQVAAVLKFGNGAGARKTCLCGGLCFSLSINTMRGSSNSAWPTSLVISKHCKPSSRWPLYSSICE
jgi:cytochrome c553